MRRYSDDVIAADSQRKLVFVTGARQVGKTTISQQLQAGVPSSQYLNFDVASDSARILRQSWPPETRLLVPDELHKMSDWKYWLKGVIDGRPAGQQQLVTGNACMDTFRQTGDSLAGRFLSWRLHPISVKEWCELSPKSEVGELHSPDAALEHLLKRGGFPEPCLFPDTPDGDNNAHRGRAKYADGLIREDVLEFSRIQEVGGMRVCWSCCVSAWGFPLSLASIGRDLGLSQPTVKRFIDILQALYIVFTVQFLQDAEAVPVNLYYVRTKEGTEIDFALSSGKVLTHLIECKWADDTPHKAFAKFIPLWSQAQAIQLARHLRAPEKRNGVLVTAAAPWLATLKA